VKRAAVLAAVAFALPAAGCGSRHSAPVPSIAWAPVARACSSGAPDCVTLVVAAMTRRYRPLAAACNHDAAFALMYLRVTEAVGRAEPTFAARRYLAQLDARFAKLYFDAYDNWRSGRRAAVPLAWQIAFEATEKGRVTGVGDLLLGMNAHISRDLPFAVRAAGAAGAADRRSFEQVNTVLERVAKPMLGEESRRFDSTISRFSLPVLSASPDTFGALLAGWRNDALQDADRLVHAASAKERAAVALSIERKAATRAALIAAATSRVPYSRAGKERDAFCRSNPA
jgi:hypothetical protein